MRIILVALAIVLSAQVMAEESATFTLATGVAISEQSESNSETVQSVRIRKAKGGYEVLVNTFTLCSGKFAAPWIGTGENPSLVIQKEKSAGPFHNGEECMYKLNVSVAADRLTSKQILYVVSNQEVVGHVRVP